MEIITFLLLLLIVLITAGYIYWYIRNTLFHKIKPSPYSNIVLNMSGIYPQYHLGRELYYSISQDKITVLECFLPIGLPPDPITNEKPQEIKPVKICLPLNKRQVLAPGEAGQLGMVRLYPLDLENLELIKIGDEEMKENYSNKIKDQNVYNIIIKGQNEQISRINEIVERFAGGELTDMQLKIELSSLEKWLRLRTMEIEQKKIGEKVEEKS